MMTRIAKGWHFIRLPVTDLGGDISLQLQSAGASGEGPTQTSLKGEEFMSVLRRNDPSLDSYHPT